MRFTRVFALLLLASTLPACATITTGSSQGISVITEPPGASCSVQREGATIGVVNPTPGTVQIGKSVHSMSVRCTKEGHSAGVTAVPAQFQPMTFGNVLIGGVIGIVVDAASGAMGRYPESVTVGLPAQAFSTGQARDNAFAEHTVTVQRNFQERLLLIRSECGTDNRLQCDSRIRSLETERDAELTRLDQLRAAARIGT